MEGQGKTTMLLAVCADMEAFVSRHVLLTLLEQQRVNVRIEPAAAPEDDSRKKELTKLEKLARKQENRARRRK